MRIGVLGGGQLGRMLALSGHRLGVTVRCMDTSPDAPAAAVGEFVCGRFDDPAALDALADGCDAVTFEFENVPAAALEHIARRVPVLPPISALRTGQNREEEKALFEKLGIPVAPYTVVRAEADVAAAAQRAGKVVVKTCTLGYDGKGQEVVPEADGASIRAAWERLGRVPVIVEEFVPFQSEVSIIAVRAQDGEMREYDITRNVHRDGILRRSMAPAFASEHPLAQDARRYVRAVMEAMEYVGVLAIEFFVVQTRDGLRLMANEMAPRVHNSGHWTMDGARTCQFENHIRAVAGLPLGETTIRGYVAMINIIGELPPLARLMACAGASVHLYGKQALPGRKLGHVNIVRSSERELKGVAEEVRELIDPASTR